MGNNLYVINGIGCLSLTAPTGLRCRRGAYEEVLPPRSRQVHQCVCPEQGLGETAPAAGEPSSGLIRTILVLGGCNQNVGTQKKKIHGEVEQLKDRGEVDKAS